MNEFLSCDWGTSNFRLRRVNSETEEVIEEVTSDEGIAHTFSKWKNANLADEQRIHFYRNVLKDAIGRLPNDALYRGIPVIISGMASSSIGMKELSYVKFPLDCKRTNPLNIFRIDADADFPFPILLVSGCSTQSDIMRGEEIILLGCHINKEGEGMFILPGTHSKHIYVRDGVAYDFKTYVTGELFNLLVNQSIFANSVQQGDDEESFQQGVADAQKENILNSIFSIRAKHVLHRTSFVKNYQYLSGLLIGTELKGLKNNSAAIHVVSEPPLMKAYELGLGQLSGSREIYCHSSNDALVRGHCRLVRVIVND